MWTQHVPTGHGVGQNVVLIECALSSTKADASTGDHPFRGFDALEASDLGGAGAAVASRRIPVYVLDPGRP